MAFRTKGFGLKENHKVTVNEHVPDFAYVVPETVESRDVWLVDRIGQTIGDLRCEHLERVPTTPAPRVSHGRLTPVSSPAEVIQDLSNVANLLYELRGPCNTTSFLFAELAKLERKMAREAFTGSGIRIPTIRHWEAI